MDRDSFFRTECYRPHNIVPHRKYIMICSGGWWPFCQGEQKNVMGGNSSLFTIQRELTIFAVYVSLLFKFMDSWL